MILFKDYLFCKTMNYFRVKLRQLLPFNYELWFANHFPLILYYNITSLSISNCQCYDYGGDRTWILLRTKYIGVFSKKTWNIKNICLQYLNPNYLMYECKCPIQFYNVYDIQCIVDLPLWNPSLKAIRQWRPFLWVPKVALIEWFYCI